MPKKITIDDLARMVKRGFDTADKKLDEAAKQVSVNKLEERVYKIEGAIIQISDTLAAMRKDIYEIKTRFVYRNEFEDLMGRVSYLEKKAGVKSGK